MKNIGDRKALLAIALIAFVSYVGAADKNEKKIDLKPKPKTESQKLNEQWKAASDAKKAQDKKDAAKKSDGKIRFNTGLNPGKELAGRYNG